MGRDDVYPNQSGNGYLLDVQADILQPLNTRAVVPLLPVSEAPKPAKVGVLLEIFRGASRIASSCAKKSKKQSIINDLKAACPAL